MRPWFLRILLLRPWLLVIAFINAIGLMAGLIVLRTPAALAPPTEIPPAELPQIPPVHSIEELRQLRDRLQAELKQLSADSETSPASNPLSGAELPATVAPSQEALIKVIQALEVRIEVENTSEQRWQQALSLATEASLKRQSSTAPDTETLQQVRDLWQRAANSLKAIPPSSFIAEQAMAKAAEYDSYLSNAAYEYDTARSDFLNEIAEQSGLGSQALITVCNLNGECRRLRGNEPAASPASLIKVPIAMALMHKVNAENIGLDAQIYVDPSNYTEDVVDVGVGLKRPLRTVLFRMIDHSNNTATNQLIDYLGRDYINQFLRDQGYQVTYVNYKLVGESIMPTNFGTAPNQITSDELTSMMVDIYNRRRPGDEVLVEALRQQYDLALGYKALQGTSAKWLGEKTGQNSKALGTTVAMSIDGQTYIVTVIGNYTGWEEAIRQCVNKIALHIDRQGGHL